MENKHLSLLISKVAKRDMEAFEELYNFMKRGVYSFALSHVNNIQLAEDILQETFLSIFNASKNYKHQNPKAWILTISRNVSLNMLRKLNNEVIFYKEDDCNKEGTVDFVDGICNSDIIQTLLTKLEPCEREIIILHLVSELKHREIAEVLDLPLGTVLWKYNISIKKLKKFVDL